jgi:hypothetical protein
MVAARAHVQGKDYITTGSPEGNILVRRVVSGPAEWFLGRCLFVFGLAESRFGSAVAARPLRFSYVSVFERT